MGAPAEGTDTQQDDQPDPHEVARFIVLRQLTVGARTRAQLAAKLAQRGCPDDVADTVLDRMTEVGLIDDAAYARALVASKHQTKGLSRRALAHELRSRGVEPEVGQDALADLSQEQERGRARELVDKRLASLHGLPPPVQVRRLAGMLARKGYPGDLAMAVIREAMAQAREHERD
ncbi:MAG: regulatory protein RecX [Austwickia sp.]|nr:regulatory protein RecX [Austwickia sp.]MBK9101410.1 regulatory protein RecX [Austwickia sp.]